MCKCKECFKELDYRCYGFHSPPGQADEQAGAGYVCSVHKEGGLVSRTVSLVLSRASNPYKCERKRLLEQIRHSPEGPLAWTGKP